MSAPAETGPPPITARGGREMCFNRGFVGGHMTGHQLPGRYGVACAGKGA